jgi:hypothetical protein
VWNQLALRLYLSGERSLEPSLIGGNMRRSHRLTLLFAVSSIVLSCAAGSQSDSARPRGSSRNVITQEELAALPQQLSALDAVRRLRSTWLRTRGMAGMGAAQSVRIYVDNVHAGDVSFLEGRPLDGIVEMRYFGGTDATTKWGTGVGGGVIELITRR